MLPKFTLAFKMIYFVFSVLFLIYLGKNSIIHLSVVDYSIKIIISISLSAQILISNNVLQHDSVWNFLYFPECRAAHEVAD